MSTKFAAGTWQPAQLTRSASPTTPVSVNFATSVPGSGNPATPGVDYAATSGVLLFPRRFLGTLFFCFHTCFELFLNGRYGRAGEPAP